MGAKISLENPHLPYCANWTLPTRARKSSEICAHHFWIGFKATTGQRHAAVRFDSDPLTLLFSDDANNLVINLTRLVAGVSYNNGFAAPSWPAQ
jgi:hypothetical protein